MSGKAKLRPGEIRIVIGMLALLGGLIWLPVLLFGQMPEFRALKSEGRTVEGVIRAKETQLASGSRRRRESAGENFYFVVAFDPRRGVPYGPANSAAGKEAPPAAPRSGKDIVAGMFGPKSGSSVPAMGSVTVRLHAGSYANFEERSIGDGISVTFLPDDPRRAKLTDAVHRFDPLPSILAALGLLAGGIVTILSGFKRRAAAIGTRSGD